ncbi:tRNA (guanine(9)-N(1))-methyltransferase [Aspergillus mulundensis]|uniref:tRNA (guanine(9)-N1)-methyltransferase n=1 Tax=Aspergillus mulundensis TaxID=1810919 RepID=A0A3D8SKA1_9EURO|nr:tRNA (guanine(9)-N1)-methyltransferase [Aspergillus mulundensis]RDW86733.1 tRNA (guanine(9)-N1)-methyltransferase [Aspergillus mulundensis]
MEEEERPRKIQKLEGDEAQESEPLMTGAIECAQDNAPLAEQATAETATSGASIENVKGPKESTPMPAANETGSTEQKVSKRQLRRQAQKEQWEAGREERKVIRKQKTAARKERRRELWDELKRQGKDPAEEINKLFPMTTRTRNRKSTRLPLTLIIDCGFDDLMQERERVSLAQQLTRSYSENNKSPFNGHMVMSSFNKKLKERFETVLHNTHQGWKGINFTEEDWFHAAKEASEVMQGPKGGQLVGPFEDKADAKPEDGEIVYLSSDSSETLTELKPYSTYIIGGLVDKNRYKGICHQRATELGIRTAKLPIGEYIQMNSRPVLATNHVVELMVRWLQLRDWGEAFMQTLPPRKGGALRDAAKGQRDSTPRDFDADAELSSEKEAAPETSEVIEATEAATADNDAVQENKPVE